MRIELQRAIEQVSGLWGLVAAVLEQDRFPQAAQGGRTAAMAQVVRLLKTATRQWPLLDFQIGTAEIQPGRQILRIVHGGLEQRPDGFILRCRYPTPGIVAPQRIEQECRDDEQQAGQCPSGTLRGGGAVAGAQERCGDEQRRASGAQRRADDKTDHAAEGGSSSSVMGRPARFRMTLTAMPNPARSIRAGAAQSQALCQFMRGRNRMNSL